ncbi:S8 family serine peptidase [Actinokineospora auranticolor]|uniref:S8 family peptidase n=1 Tax=Actinokineospora auranticolor TaxID=155976 RepID=UPI0035A8C612
MRLTRTCVGGSRRRRTLRGRGGEDADKDGHGTHVASTIAGTGAASSGKYVGVAPDARLLVGKVCGSWGCPESAILAGIQWAVDSGVKIINLSLGGTDSEAVDPLEEAVNRLSDRALFVVAAGNDGGYGAETVSSPASADAALAVGAVDKSDRMASFSGRGPRVGDAGVKPEIVAPGVNITAARSKYSALGKKRDRYVSLGGTSMATPHVAGSAALLLQRHPEWTGQRLKAALVASAKRLDGVGAFEQGAGRVDVSRAVNQVGYAEPSVVSVGRQSWPHEDDPVVVKEVSYVNTADVPLVLRLSVEGGTAGWGAAGRGVPERGAAEGWAADGGAPKGGTPEKKAGRGVLEGGVPEGMFVLSGREITVPPRGKAGVKVAVDTRLGDVEGVHSAWIVAEGGTERITTPVAVDREAESYDLAVKALDDKGVVTDSNYTLLWGVDAYRFRPIWTMGGAGKVRVRRGTYHVDTVVSTYLPDGLIASRKVVRPSVSVTGDTAVVLDSGAARQIRVEFARAGVRSRAVGAGYARRMPWGNLYAGIIGDSLDRIYTAQVGGPVSTVVADIGGGFYVPDAAGGVEGSTVTYNLAWFQAGELPTGFSRRVEDEPLARVESTYRQVQNKRSGTKLWLVSDPVFRSGSGYGLPVALPLTRTEFYDPRAGDWAVEFQQWRVVRKQIVTDFVSGDEKVRHEPGQVYREDWNSAVIGPGLPRNGLAVRINDTISLGVPLFTDSPRRVGSSTIESAATALYRDGQLVGQTNQPGQGVFEVPEQSASYRLETTASRAAPLSPRVSAVWSFTSARPQARKGGVQLPLLAVRFGPEGLDSRNHATGRSVRTTVQVGRQPDLPAVPIVQTTVSASFDDGTTWVDVPVVDGVVTVTHPRGTRFVSLRAKAVDAQGSAVEQTVVRAYGT